MEHGRPGARCWLQRGTLLQISLITQPEFIAVAALTMSPFCSVAKLSRLRLTMLICVARWVEAQSNTVMLLTLCPTVS